jgi:hypothetical protein
LDLGLRENDEERVVRHVTGRECPDAKTAVEYLPICLAEEGLQECPAVTIDQADASRGVGVDLAVLDDIGGATAPIPARN